MLSLWKFFSAHLICQFLRKLLRQKYQIDKVKGKDIGVGIIVKRIGRMMYFAKGPKMVYKKHLNASKSRYIDEEIDTPVDVELMKVPFGTFDVPIPRKDPEAKRQKRQRGKEWIQREST